MSGKQTEIVPACELIAGPSGTGGDFLAGLDNGYVVEAYEADYHGNWEIVFHTAEGNEATLTIPGDVPVLILQR